MSSGLPRLIVLTGRPGSGKSTLGPLLAEGLRLPLVSRDVVKERLTAELGTAPENVRANDAFFSEIRTLLESRTSLIAEAAFQDRVWAPKLEEFRSCAEIRIVVCAVDYALARRRHEDRARLDPDRARYHDVGPLSVTYEPPRLAVPTLVVDTSDGYLPGFDQIVAFARDAL